MNYILFDDKQIRENLKPLTFFRPIAEIRLGILTLREKWEHYLGAGTSTLSEKYLEAKFPLRRAEDNILINAAVLPSARLVEYIKKMKMGDVLVANDTIIALYASKQWFEDGELSGESQEVSFEGTFEMLTQTYEIFVKNPAEIVNDFSLLTRGRESKRLDDSCVVNGDGEVFVEEGAKMKNVIFNTSEGPVYIGKNAEIMEGSLIRGPFAMNEHAIVKMHAKIYGGCTLGPYTKVAGEISNVIFFGYSNKGHDGFLGNSVVAEWCNFGAGTNNSNLKNDYGSVKLWNYSASSFVDTGLQFCGLIMGDHSKCAIGTIFNTGTVVGVNANIFGAGFHRNFIPSFSWGGSADYKLSKALKVAKIVYGRRNVEFDQIEEDIFRHVYNLTSADGYL